MRETTETEKNGIFDNLRQKDLSLLSERLPLDPASRVNDVGFRAVMARP
jgi:hypothetical protein